MARENISITTRTRVSFRVQLAVSLALLSGAILLPMRCVTVGPSTAPNFNINGSACQGSCSSTTVKLDVEGNTLTLTALAAKNKLTGLQCPNGDLACPTLSNTNTNANANAQCCRRSVYDIKSFTFTAEGVDQCQGGGGTTSKNVAQVACTSKEQGLTEVLKSLASTIDIYRCVGDAGRTDCGYVVTGSGKVTILECPNGCTIEAVNIPWEKTCKPTIVEGFWDEYRIQLSASMSQSCVTPAGAT